MTSMFLECVIVILTWVPLDVHFGKDIIGYKYESQQICWAYKPTWKVKYEVEFRHMGGFCDMMEVLDS